MWDNLTRIHIMAHFWLERHFGILAIIVILKVIKEWVT